MKRLLTITLLAMLAFNGCSFSKLSAVEYNNHVVEALNASGSTLENSATVYNEVIPNVVNEKIEIESGELRSALSKAKSAQSELATMMSNESRDLAQQEAVRSSLETYLDISNEYLKNYQEALNYYQNGDYQKDLSQVEVLDQKLHDSYAIVVEANNDLVSTLAQFVKKQ